jgi:hypothetical protein
MRETKVLVDIEKGLIDVVVVDKVGLSKDRRRQHDMNGISPNGDRRTAIRPYGLFAPGIVERAAEKCTATLPAVSKPPTGLR